jgi:formate/nitrite transporter
MIALGGAAANTAAHSAASAGAGRMAAGLLFPFALGIIMLTGMELFTGNCMIAISVLAKKASLRGMLKNWGAVYAGNFAGGLLVAASCAFFGQMDLSGGGLAVYTINLAAAKCALPFGTALVFGVLCNALVCLGVLCSLSAKDTAGRILGAYIPVALFVICGFEHSVANMFFVPAGLFANAVPEYSAAAALAGVDTSALTWGAFLLNNLLPVTIGNIVGGAGIAAALWKGHRKG